MTLHPDAIRAMEAETLEIKDGDTVVGLAVRLVERDEDSPAFFYDTDWLEWLREHRGLTVVGSMAAVDIDTEGKFIWFVAVR